MVLDKYVIVLPEGKATPDQIKAALWAGMEEMINMVAFPVAQGQVAGITLELTTVRLDGEQRTGLEVGLFLEDVQVVSSDDSEQMSLF